MNINFDVKATGHEKGALGVRYKRKGKSKKGKIRSSMISIRRID